MQWLFDLIVNITDYLANSLLEIFSMDLAYFERAIPIIPSVINIIIIIGWALLIGNLLFQSIKSMATGLGFDGEDPRTLFMRTFVMAFFLSNSLTICQIGLNLANNCIQLLQLPTEIEVPKMEESLFDVPGDASWLLAIILGIILIWQIIKLFFEIGERYVIVIIMAIGSPLAFSMGGSKSTEDILKGWVRMFASMCLMMFLSVLFLKLLLSAMGNVPDGARILPWMIFIVALARVSRKIDSIIARIGLNTAVTGDPLTHSNIPGMLTAMVFRNVASTVGSSIKNSTAKAEGAGGGKSVATPSPSGGKSVETSRTPKRPPIGGVSPVGKTDSTDVLPETMEKSDMSKAASPSTVRDVKGARPDFDESKSGKAPSDTRKPITPAMAKSASKPEPTKAPTAASATDKRPTAEGTKKPVSIAKPTDGSGHTTIPKSADSTGHATTLKPVSPMKLHDIKGEGDSTIEKSPTDKTSSIGSAHMPPSSPMPVKPVSDWKADSRTMAPSHGKTHSETEVKAKSRPDSPAAKPIMPKNTAISSNKEISIHKSQVQNMDKTTKKEHSGNVAGASDSSGKGSVPLKAGATFNGKPSRPIRTPSGVSGVIDNTKESATETKTSASSTVSKETSAGSSASVLSHELRNSGTLSAAAKPARPSVDAPKAGAIAAPIKEKPSETATPSTPTKQENKTSANPSLPHTNRPNSATPKANHEAKMESSAAALKQPTKPDIPITKGKDFSKIETRPVKSHKQGVKDE